MQQIFQDMGELEHVLDLLEDEPQPGFALHVLIYNIKSSGIIPCADFCETSADCSYHLMLAGNDAQKAGLAALGLLLRLEDEGGPIPPEKLAELRERLIEVHAWQLELVRHAHDQIIASRAEGGRNQSGTELRELCASLHKKFPERKNAEYWKWMQCSADAPLAARDKEGTMVFLFWVDHDDRLHLKHGEKIKSYTFRSFENKMSKARKKSSHRK